MSHHISIFNAAGIKIGHLRITNEARVLSIWLSETAVANSGLFIPEFVAAVEEFEDVEE